MYIIFNNTEYEIGKFIINKDYSHSESSGAGGMFQITSITLETSDGEEVDVTSLVDQGKHYSSAGEVINDMGYSVNKVDYEEDSY